MHYRAELTKEQITRVYAMYCYCDIAFPSDGPEAYWLNNGWSWGVISGTHYGVTNTRLILTPLFELSEEDAIVCSDILFGSNNNWTKGAKVQNAVYHIERYLVQDDNYPKRIGMYTEVRQYLMQKGYAVPLYIEPNHKFNGKTAIELEIAITKAELKDNKPKQ